MQWCTGCVGDRHGACFGKASDVGMNWWLWHIFSHLEKKKKIEYKKGIFSGLECIYSSYSTMYWCFIKLFYLFARCLLVRRRTQRLGRSFAVTEPSLWPEQSGLVSVAPKLAVPTTLCFVDTVPHAFVQIQGISQKGLALHICTHMEDECNSSTHCRLGVCKTFFG